jgi:hypothetical protein
VSSKREIVDWFAMSKYLMAAIIFVVFLTNWAARAEDDDERTVAANVYMTGEHLTQHCRTFREVRRRGGYATAQEYHDAALCYGFVVGMADNAIINGLFKRTAICLPAKINANDLAEVVAIFLDEHPERRRFSGYAVVVEAFAHSFPCQNK